MNDQTPRADADDVRMERDIPPEIGIPPNAPDEPGMRGTYAQTDYSPAAQRNAFRQDQHYEVRPQPDDAGPDPYGEGGFAGGGMGQSGYGSDFHQLEGADRGLVHHPSERDVREAGTASKSSR